ncbi:leucine-rich repeat protein [Clostridium perfringens]|uniref:leucine-rich repeat domain-containing protein n=1 Tax=Clostridium perfringens TaxID=1502 RepID=UPI0039E774E3
MADNSFNNDSVSKSTIPGGGGATNSVISPKNIDCSLIENPSDLADYEYAVIDDKLIEKQIQDRQSNIDPDNPLEIRGGYCDDPSYGSWEDEFRKRMTSLKGQIAITGYNGNKTEIKIPSCIDGKKVVAIGVLPFRWDTPVKKITIPNSVVFLCSYSMPEELESVDIPDSVKFIDDYCFHSTHLKSITIPKTVEEVGYYAFEYSKLQSVTIESAYTKIDAGVFIDSQISTINLPNGIKKIPDWIFCNTKITEIKIPESVTEIGKSAFCNCGLTSISIGKNVSKIDNSAFYDNHLTELTIPNSVTEIGDDVFGSNKLTSVTMPKRFDAEKEKYFNGYYHDNQVANIKFNLI